MINTWAFQEAHPILHHGNDGGGGDGAWYSEVALTPTGVGLQPIGNGRGDGYGYGWPINCLFTDGDGMGCGVFDSHDSVVSLRGSGGVPEMDNRCYNYRDDGDGVGTR